MQFLRVDVAQDAGGVAAAEQQVSGWTSVPVTPPIRASVELRWHW
jgi:hypothetical protein